MRSVREEVASDMDDVHFLLIICVFALMVITIGVTRYLEQSPVDHPRIRAEQPSFSVEDCKRMRGLGFGLAAFHQGCKPTPGKTAP